MKASVGGGARGTSDEAAARALSAGASRRSCRKSTRQTEVRTHARVLSSSFLFAKFSVVQNSLGHAPAPQSLLSLFLSPIALLPLSPSAACCSLASAAHLYTSLPSLLPRVQSSCWCRSFRTNNKRMPRHLDFPYPSSFAFVITRSDFPNMPRGPTYRSPLRRHHPYTMAARSAHNALKVRRIHASLFHPLLTRPPSHRSQTPLITLVASPSASKALNRLVW